jgi:hypothetical protein
MENRDGCVGMCTAVDVRYVASIVPDTARGIHARTLLSVPSALDPCSRLKMTRHRRMHPE